MHASVPQVPPSEVHPTGAQRGAVNLTVCVPTPCLQFICSGLDPKCDGVGGRGLWEVMRLDKVIRQSFYDGISALVGRETRKLSSLPSTLPP